MDIALITTEDGSHSLRNIALNETYHSIHGAIQESQHVFIQAGLQYLLRKNPKDINILEIGFGTGLNALLTTIYQKTVPIHYTAFEPYPIEASVYDRLNYPSELGANKKLFLALHEANWNNQIEINQGFALHKIHARYQETILPSLTFDLVYFDAFAPEKQPELWELPVLNKIYQAMKPDAVLVTYCAKGQFKRNLKSIGFNVESLPGPPGKFQMTRAIKI
ncbi:MAG: tRNA (5-methylaminomethyl-2-thiouridine)(34)-methyltransferase MnmD [Bacteroidetes bacterium]|nr:tRNA (5-methylaminomethyl-2-thiouridine)(34)-methyltransferase MnmD [Bacteroidota bacterium]MDA1119679.1 tRNA (5-methylaminomethyl-2-thiouridine)(34)-methyltransferase MnmD [Bacteroidota bacterium]